MTTTATPTTQATKGTQPTPPQAGVVKVTVNLPEDLLEKVKQLATQRNATVTETLRQLLESGLFIRDEVKSGAKVLLDRGVGNLREIFFTR